MKFTNVVERGQADSDFTMAWLSWGRMEEELGQQQMARDKYTMGCRANRGKGTVQLWQVCAHLLFVHLAVNVNICVAVF